MVPSKNKRSQPSSPTSDVRRPIYFAAGGTGGHIYPALAVASVLRRRYPHLDIRFIGVSEHLEGQLVPAAGYPMLPIQVQGLPRRFNRRLLYTLGQLARSSGQLYRQFRRERPHLVAGFGGYVGAPALLAACMSGIPSLIHEQNALPGLTNRLLGRWVDLVAVSFAATASSFPADRTIVTGNPVREAFGGEREAARRTVGLRENESLLVVFGGSQGARSLNRALLPLLPEFLADADWRILHVCGASDWAYCREATAAWSDQQRYNLLPYCEDLPVQLLAADLAVTRAGATTVAEVVAAGLPCVLVPYPHARAHQEANARPLVDAGAALLLADAELTPARLREVVRPLLEKQAHLAAMRERLATLAPCPPAAERLAGLMESLLQLTNDRGREADEELKSTRGETQPCSR